ncbi:MAG TPA: M10 family metallopeptidase C-terminal domain-containing protein, partial [Allosphingosinicella sp.]|nr:M10 family metallopeptidase C-terminal domain-containing protein [Allosphingosinicella sp.]
MSKAFRGTTARIAKVEATEYFTGRQYVLAASGLDQAAAPASPFASKDAAASAPSFDITVDSSDELLPLGFDGKLVPFGLACITDEKMLHLMALDSVDGAGFQFQILRDPSVIEDESVVSITVGGNVSGVIDFSGDTDDITVTLVAGVRYMISLRGTGATALADSYLEVFNPSNVIVNHDDDGGIGANSLMTITAAVSGVYTIRAASFASMAQPGTTGGYTVDVRQMGADTVSSNTNAATPFINQGTTFGFRETSSGSAIASNAQDVDSYKVHLEAGKYYTFSVAGGADSETDPNNVPVGEIDTVLLLINPAGTAIVVSNDDINFPGDISSALGFYATTTGDYFLQIRGYGQGNGAGGIPSLVGRNTGGYVIDFREVPLTQVNILDSINWDSAANMPTVNVSGVQTVYVYFAVAGENFGENARAGDPTQPAGGGNGTLLSYGWNAYEKTQFMAAMLEYTKILGIQYVETSVAAQAGLRVITNSSLAYGAYAYPQDPAYGTQKGIAVFNVDNRGWNDDDANPAITTDGLGRGGYAWSTILHEMGHAHGLSHPHDTGGGSDVMAGVTAAQGSLGVFNLNQQVYTQMSYNGGWWTHPDGSVTGTDPTGFRSDAGWGATLGAFDIALLQARYGVHPDFATGDTTYTLNDINAEGTFFECIYDTAGNDTIIYNGIRGAQIDLNTATLDYTVTGGGVMSFVHNLAGETAAMAIKGGYTIANGVVIENATGGSGNDVLIGNVVANVLTGNNGNDSFMGQGGNDILVGGAGTDTAYYDGVRSHYTITLNIGSNGSIS